MTTTIDQTPAEKEIHAAIDAWAQAIRMKDASGVEVLFAEDAVDFFLAPPLQATGPLKQNLEEWFASFDGAIGYEIRSLQTATSGDLAYSHSFNRVTGRKLEGPYDDVWFRQTICFRKIDHRWLITHVHESVPFYMDGTFKAAVDLQPPAGS